MMRPSPARNSRSTIFGTQALPSSWTTFPAAHQARPWYAGHGPALRHESAGEVGVLRVAPDVGADERALDHRAQTTLADVVQGGPGERGPDALALEGRVHLGMGQDDPLPAQPVRREAGQLAVEPGLVAGLLRGVGHHDVVVTHAVQPRSRADGAPESVCRPERRSARVTG